jgi:hypothetical protein
MQLLAETIANAFRFSQDLHEAWRKCAGDCDGPVRGIDHVFAPLLS